MGERGWVGGEGRGGGERGNDWMSKSGIEQSGHDGRATAAAQKQQRDHQPEMHDMEREKN